MPELLKPLELKIESNLINALNFVVFDIVLISAVFILTSDVMGRLNDAALRDGRPRRLIIACPPVLGGGLCSTHRVRVVLLLTARLLGLLLILATNLTITGESRKGYSVERDIVIAPGSLTNMTSDQYSVAVLTRTGCVGNANLTLRGGNEPNETTSYYGELRGSKCITNIPLLTESPVRFGNDIVYENMTTGACPNRRKRARGNVTVAEFFCETGVLQCRFEVERPTVVDVTTCRGVLRRGDDTFISEEGAPWPEMPDEKTEARLVRGIDWKDRSWMDAVFVNTDSMVDSIHAVYGASTQEKDVRIEKDVQYTLVNPLWFAALALKLLLVAVLGITSLFLMRAGFRTVLHDEQRLAELLNRRLEENDPGVGLLQREEGPNIYLEADQPGGSGMIVRAASRPGWVRSGTAIEQSGPNLQLHIDEAQHY